MMARRWRGTTTNCVTLISFWTDEGGRRLGNEKALTRPRKIYNRWAYDNVHRTGAGGVTPAFQVARRLSDQDIMRRYRMNVPIAIFPLAYRYSSLAAVTS
jgi:hypothetical protein